MSVIEGSSPYLIFLVTKSSSLCVAKIFTIEKTDWSILRRVSINIAELEDFNPLASKTSVTN